MVCCWLTRPFLCCSLMTLRFALLMVMCVLISGVFTQKISCNRQHFEVHRSSSVIQKVHGCKNTEPETRSHTDLESMELLRNTAILQLNRTSCIMSGATSPAHSTEANKTVNKTQNGNISFVNIAKTLGIHHVHRQIVAARPRCSMDFIIPTLNSPRMTKLVKEFCVPEHITGGAAVGDYNNDGLEDIYFTVFYSRSVLYKNNGDNTFTDVTEDSRVGPDRYGNGASWADVDQDGDLDLYVTTVGDTRHYLYINYGGWFKEEALDRNCSLQFSNKRKLAGMSVNFGDFDADGYPDLYVTEWIPHTLGKPSASRLLRNKGGTAPGYFEDVTDLYGVDMDRFQLERYNLSSGTYSFASSFTDFDNDGLPDLLVTADFGESRMFWNMGRNYPFHECTERCGLNGEQDAMGHAIGDWNNDGLMDWFSSAIRDNTTNCEIAGCTFDDGGNRLYRNLGARSFSDITEQAGVKNGGWGWGAAFLDFNNDGYQDLVMTNGMNLPTTTTDDHFDGQQMRLWQNLGEGFNGKTKEVASELGMNSTNQGRGLLKWDFDDDGDIDVVVCNNVGAPEIYENVGGNKQNWIKVMVKHSCKSRPEFLCASLGARVEVKQSGTGHTQTQEVGSSTHFLAQSELTTHFGLGSNVNNLTVHVTWPATKSQLHLYDVPPNVRLQVVEPLSGKEKIQFSTLKKCPSLRIVDIPKQPSKGVVTINKNGRTVRFTKHPSYTFEDMKIQNFTYKVQLYPSATTITSESRVYVAFMNDIEKSDRECHDGKPSGYEKLKPTDDRRFDGISNNKHHLMWGAAGGNLRRSTPPAYSDGIADPASVCNNPQRRNRRCPHNQEYSGYGSTRPSPREISNLLFRQTGSITSARRINDFHVHFGQFISHDTDLTTTLPRFEFQDKLNDVWLPITVPKGDVYFDLGDSESSYLPFVRSIYNRCTGREANIPREQINTISSYIDAGMVYGSSVERNKHLRTFVDGKMKVWEQQMMPLNIPGVANANEVGRETKRLFVAGDSRANEQPGLMAIHTIFLREHNRLCDIYLERKPNASDDEVFQYARKIVASELQAITFREYLPSVLGGSEDIPPYTGYNDSIDATADHILVTAAFRFGHSQVNNLLWRLDDDGKPIKEGHLPLRDAYFSPERILHEGGIDPIIRGAFAQPAQEVDTKMVDDVRNFLFALNRRGHDLSSINIQRGRDHGLPDLNTVRATIGLPKYLSFSEITRNEQTVRDLRVLYRDINNVDLWVGGLAEDHVKGEVGPTFRKIIIDSFLRIRDGDRFWYQNILTSKEIELVESLTLSEIIRLNTNITEVPRHIFYSTKHCADVRNDRCIEYNITKDEKCDQKSEEIHTLNQSLISLELQRQALSAKLAFFRENCTKQRLIKENDNPLREELTELRNETMQLEQRKQQLSRDIENLEMKKNQLSGSSSEDSSLPSIRLIILVLLGVLSIMTIILAVMYLRSRRNRTKVSIRENGCNNSKNMGMTTL